MLANEIGNDRIPMTMLHQVLRSLLSERVAIRDLPRIVETLSVAAGERRNPEDLADECRAVLGAQIAATGDKYSHSGKSAIFGRPTSDPRASAEPTYRAGIGKKTRGSCSSAG